MAQIILKARLVCSLPALDPDELRLAVAAWNEIVEPIPDQWLDECYKRAMRSHRARDPFSASELIPIWENAVASKEVQRWQVEAGRSLARPDCEVCNNSGWQSVDVPGQGWTSKRCDCGR